MNTSGELTIVIPAKNEEKLLPRLLSSLARQDYALMSNTRVFLADADSSDRTVDVAAEFAHVFPLTIIPGGLPSVGRNNGARRALSRYLLFIDADIEIADHTLLRRTVELAKRRSLHLVTTDVLCKEGIWLDKMLYGGSNLLQRLSMWHRPFATGMFMLMEKETFDRLGGFDEEALYAEDYQLTRQIRPSKFRVLRGGVYSTNRRFIKMGRMTIVRSFLNAAFHSRNPRYFRSRIHRTYWEAY